jgi:hypothetical protein
MADNKHKIYDSEGNEVDITKFNIVVGGFPEPNTSLLKWKISMTLNFGDMKEPNATQQLLLNQFLLTEDN